MISSLINGQPATQISLGDRGLSYGDGVFRTLRIHAGRPVAWLAHWQRLEYDCARLGLVVPEQETLLRESARLFANDEPGDRHGVLKIMITRGCGGRGYGLPEEPTQSRILQRHALPQGSQDQPMFVGVCEVRLGCNPHLAGVKHLNRLEQVLARQACARAGLEEALMLDNQGWVISGTMTNLFLVKNGQLLTPRLDQAGIIGATRQRVIAAAQSMGRQTQEMHLTLKDCFDADELFVCNSIKGMCPVVRLQDSVFAPGELTLVLQAALQAEEGSN